MTNPGPTLDPPTPPDKPLSIATTDMLYQLAQIEDGLYRQAVKLGLWPVAYTHRRRFRLLAHRHRLESEGRFMRHDT